MITKGSKTEKNIIQAFAKEAQAIARYTFAAMQAREEGKEEIALFFEKMADNEREHAKIWYKIIHNSKENTLRNLRDAASGENYEWKNMYPTYADIAKSEGFETLAIMFERIAAIENDHERQFTEALLMLENGESLHRNQREKKAENYTCMFCGYIAPTALETCPVCGGENSFTL